MLTYGRHDLAEVEAGVSIPIGSTVALRLSGIYHTRDGIWNNLDTGDDSYGDEKRYSERATLVWEPSQATRLTASLHSARVDGQAQPQKMAGAMLNNPPLRINDLAPFTGNIDWKGGNLNTVGNASTVNIEGFDRFTKGWQDVWVGGSTGEQPACRRWLHKGHSRFRRSDADVDLRIRPDARPVRGGQHRRRQHRRRAVHPESPTTCSIIDMDQEYEQYTQELRLASNDDTARFRWIAGIYYLQENSLLAQDIRFGDNGFPGAHPSAVGITPPSLFDVIPNPYGNTVSFSIADLKDRAHPSTVRRDFRFTDQLDVTVGVRYTHDDKSDPFVLRRRLRQAARLGSVTLHRSVRNSALRRGSRKLRSEDRVPRTYRSMRCADTNTARSDSATTRSAARSDCNITDRMTS